MANIKGRSLLCVLLTIVQALPKGSLMDLESLAEAKFNNTLRGKGDKAGLPTVAEQTRDWEEGFDHELRACIEHDKIEGYWVQACCVKAESARWYIEYEGREKFESRVANFTVESLGNQTYMDKYNSRCEGEEVKVCVGWSETPDFEISPELKAYVVEHAIRCNVYMDWMTRLHVIPEKGQKRINICVGNNPVCPLPDQTHKLPCGQNDMAGHIDKPCPTHFKSTASLINNFASKPLPEGKQLGMFSREGWIAKISAEKLLGLFTGAKKPAWWIPNADV